mmetsp:Transcript_21465/g.59990  ORF Transcript_21465/g.59990 Transcript_21465/m.59990 type:complete len:230 (-) Transcript_21465:261-950(-)
MHPLLWIVPLRTQNRQMSGGLQKQRVSSAVRVGSGLVDHDRLLGSFKPQTRLPLEQIDLRQNLQCQGLARCVADPPEEVQCLFGSQQPFHEPLGDSSILRLTGGGFQAKVHRRGSDANLLKACRGDRKPVLRLPMSIPALPAILRGQLRILQDTLEVAAEEANGGDGLNGLSRLRQRTHRRGGSQSLFGRLPGSVQVVGCQLHPHDRLQRSDLPWPVAQLAELLQRGRR